MQRILLLLQRYYHLLLFLLIEAVCIYAIVQYNAYQQAVLFTSANEITGRVEEKRSAVTDYFYLRTENESLNQSIVKRLNDSISSSFISFSGDTFSYRNIRSEQLFSYVPARVVNNSVHLLANYLTLNRGSAHGITKGMGVIGPEGVVGKVIAVSSNFALVMSVLHTDFSLSPRHEFSENLGEYEWEGSKIDMAAIKSYSKYNKLNEGDLFVTSSYSTLFPENIPVGEVVNYRIQPESEYFEIDIKLSTDFQKLRTAYIVKNHFRMELDSLLDLR